MMRMGLVVWRLTAGLLLGEAGIKNNPRALKMQFIIIKEL